MFSPADWLAAAARTWPDRQALHVGGKSWTFAQLDAEVETLADALSDRGVSRGHRVATVLPNGELAAMLPHAILRLGAVLVPLNTRLTRAELDWQLAHVRPALVMSSDAPVVPGEGRNPHSGVRIPRDARDDRVHVDDPLVILYTSGTTGRPKGAVLTAGNFAASAAASAATLGVQPDDQWLAVLPLFHVGGLSILLRSVMQGTAVRVHERFDPVVVNHAIDSEGVTIASLVSVQLLRLLDERGERGFPPHFRCALVGGGPVPQALLERCARLGVPVAQTYGLTEATSQVSTLPPADALRKLGSAGRALPGTAIRIDGGDEGEILVRGPTVMQGYLDDPAATAAALRDGWLHTGDVGRLDEEGYLFVLDRRDDLIVTGGENVYPAEVESALAAHPSVEEAAVVGLTDPTWGQRVVAAVRLRDEVTPEVLQAHCRARLAGYKVPREIHIVRADLPRTASGKLLRSAIRQQLQ